MIDSLLSSIIKPSVELVAIPGFADPFSSLSHLVGAVIFLALSLSLLKRGAAAAKNDSFIEGKRRVLSLCIFAFAAVLLLCMSGVFHLLPSGTPARAVLRRLDHAAIFILIAGTYTPIHTILFRGGWRWGMLLLVWTIAVASVTLKTIFFANVPDWLGLTLYVGMGWIGLFSMIKLSSTRGIRFIRPLLAGGIVYTIGAIIELANMRPLIAGVFRAHEIFHVAVLGGLGLHWRFVSTIATTHIVEVPKPTSSTITTP